MVVPSSAAITLLPKPRLEFLLFVILICFPSNESITAVLLSNEKNTKKKKGFATSKDYMYCNIINSNLH